MLGHSDGSVTAIYNRYGYVKEMRAVLEKWVTELTAGLVTAVTAPAVRDIYPSVGTRADVLRISEAA